VPVVVTGASAPVGQALIPRLIEAGSEVRAVVGRQADADPLRGLGAKVAVGDQANPELLPAVLRDAHTLCFLFDGLFLDQEEYVPAIAGTAEAAVDAAGEAGVARILLLSYPGAAPDSENAYLRALGMAEEAVRGSGAEHVVVRSTLVLAPGADWPRVLGRGSHRVAPVFVEDLAAVLAAADDRAQPVTGTFGLQGPDTVTADELAGLLGRSVRQRVRLKKPRIPRAAAQILASDSLADAPDAAAEFGIKLTRLRQALQAAGFIAT
jgi:NAD(P)H dehydrogenase (quinone)